jgi:hypothetical protein
MSIRDELWSIISHATTEHEASLHQLRRAVGHPAAAFSAELLKGAAWLRSHVLPVLQELRDCLIAEHIVAEIGDHLLPSSGTVSRDLGGPALSIRLVGESPISKGGDAPRSEPYTFHCDGEFLSVTHDLPGNPVALGRPFDVEASAEDADAIVLEIIRKLLREYFESDRKAVMAQLSGLPPHGGH